MRGLDRCSKGPGSEYTQLVQPPNQVVGRGWGSGVPAPAGARRTAARAGGVGGGGLELSNHKRSSFPAPRSGQSGGTIPHPENGVRDLGGAGGAAGQDHLVTFGSSLSLSGLSFLFCKRG